MIYFIAGIATGAVIGLVSMFYLLNGNDKGTDETPEETRSNIAKQEREKLMKELQRQYENLMSYNGKEQKG
jgi:hypothetical protein